MRDVSSPIARASRMSSVKQPIPPRIVIRERRCFGEKFHQLRKRKGFARRENLAEATGLSYGMISDLELGHDNQKATVMAIKSIAKTLSCKFYPCPGEIDQYFDNDFTLGQLFRMGIVPDLIEQ